MTPTEKRKLAIEYAKSAIFKQPFLRDADKDERIIQIADIYLDGLRKGLELAEDAG